MRIEMQGPRSKVLTSLGLGVMAATLTLAVMPVVVVGPEAGAVPAFARRYQTSCVTCHIGFPRLNPFGEAFRRAGYRFPVDNEDFIEEEVVSLGHPAYTRVFPNAVWPNAMALIPPISVVTQSWVSLIRDAESGDLRFSMEDLEAMGEIFATAWLGERVSVFGRFGLGGIQTAAWHQRYFATINDLLPHTTIRIGDFHPEVFQRERDCNTCHFALSRPVGDNTWGWTGDLGVELAGTTLNGRLRLVAGVLDGNGNVRNDSVDFYARIGTKIGGLRLDGVVDEDSEGPSDPWVDNSLELGVFGYLGDARVSTVDAHENAIEVDDSFKSAGVDFFFTWADLGLYGAAIFEEHSQPTGTDSDVGVDRFIARLRYVVYPWLIPEVNFEYFNSGLPADLTLQVQPIIDVLFRANVKFSLQAFLLRDVRSDLVFDSGRVTMEFGF